MLFIERNDPRNQQNGRPDDCAIDDPRPCGPADRFEIAGRLEAHAQAARGALADQTCRALASDSRIWSAWCAERNVSALPAEPTAVVAFVDAQAELGSELASSSRTSLLMPDRPFKPHSS